MTDNKPLPNDAQNDSTFSTIPDEDTMPEKRTAWLAPFRDLKQARAFSQELNKLIEKEEAKAKKQSVEAEQPTKVATITALSSKYQKTLQRLLKVKSRSQNGLGCSSQTLNELLQLGYIERGGVRDRYMTYQLTDAGRAVLNDTDATGAETPPNYNQ